MHENLEPVLPSIAGNYAYINNQGGVKRGEEVFDELRKALHKIRDDFLESERLDPYAEEKLMEIEGEIAYVARLLAGTLLTELKDEGLTAASAVEEYNKGLQSFSEAAHRSSYEDQISKYKEAWVHGVKVLKLEWGITIGLAKPP